VSSVLDLACGMNPLAIPWMPLTNNFQYAACDIYLDMLGLIMAYFDHFNFSGNIFPCDLVSTSPSINADVTFLLKTIPCLEQVDKSIGARLLQMIPSKSILVSFPIHSLGGRQKGMLHFYTEHFYGIVSEMNWEVEEFVFATELAFLIKK
jgi:16S rRNA (guanine(1405)-N(7))-methyltransferase